MSTAKIIRYAISAIVIVFAFSMFLNRMAEIQNFEPKRTLQPGKKAEEPESPATPQ